MQCTTDTLEKDKYSKQKRHFKDPDLGKTKVAIDMTAVDKAIFKQACKLANLTQGEFVARAAREYMEIMEAQCQTK